MSEEKKKEEKEKKQRKPKAVPVKVIVGRGKSTLVEWLDDGNLHRAYVPVAKVSLREDEGISCDADTLAQGIPYGVPWDELMEFKIDRSAIANELRRCGIWTSKDLEVNPKALRRIVDKMTGLTPGHLRRAAAQYEKKGAKK